MKPALTLFSLAAFSALLGVSIWATQHVGVMQAVEQVLARPGEGSTPWFVATLFDACFGFLWFWLWVAYKETSWLVRGLWLLLILALGNMAMAAYMLLQLRKLGPGADARALLLRSS